ncbi:ATP-binding protein [Microbispora sp. KK1-11]|uniref:ATP-binding protein n=1 Tax=Microbispora sp. KK1-11 TaxID=2053005 RepID=UPI001157BD1D|nr:ATP-binding protein [Microbispora sp. KK1-11]TQS27212.1 ATP-binding protein [Microbispora sp. KK1-11]
MSLLYCPVRDESSSTTRGGDAPVASQRRHSAVRHRWETLRQRVGDLAIQLVDDPDVEAASWRLPADAPSAGRARRLVGERLSAWGMENLSDVTQLLVSELVTNVLRHTCCGDLVVRLSAVEGLLRCEVEDCDGGTPEVARPSAADEHGRGLRLLESLACCWGAERTRQGKIMWFELPAYALR